MIKTIYTRAKKITSNTTKIEFCDTVIDGIKEYHTTVLKDSEINKRKTAPLHKISQTKITAPERMSFWRRLERMHKTRITPITCFNIDTVKNFMQLCMMEHKNLERN